MHVNEMHDFVFLFGFLLTILCFNNAKKAQRRADEGLAGGKW